MSEVLFNPSSSRSVDIEEPTREPLAFHKRFPGYAPTPLVSVPVLAHRFHLAKVWVKDESHRLGLPAFKILGASWAIYCLLEEHFGPSVIRWSSFDELRSIVTQWEPITFCCATDGNHGRGVARMAKLLGMQARIYMPYGSASARIEAIQSEGATVIVDGTYDDAVARAARECSADGFLIQDTAWSGYEKIPNWIVQGYSTLFWEIDDALATAGEPGPTMVIVQMGVGSLADAVVRHYRRPSVTSPPVLVGVEPENAACVLASVKAGRVVTLPGHQDSILAGLNCGTPSSISFPVLMKGMHCFLTIDDERAREAMRALAIAGITAGETGAAGAAGLLELLSVDHPPDIRLLLGVSDKTRVLLICTEGATDPQSYRYIVGPSP